ncbi:MAG: hypothetical protein AB7G11_02710 [Phycisphaerales bacterium]
MFGPVYFGPTYWGGVYYGGAGGGGDTPTPNPLTSNFFVVQAIRADDLDSPADDGTLGFVSVRFATDDE